ncbi:conserved hypothetical protein [Neospora caninum Liverpool]|uniref:Centrosomal protein CEP104 N-terminal domain-containing protein n=1 Tax=Neospora caninum (strain Liverpool) TaxID=572307 RepID=F0VBU9_NEOCL|nr:conserved hypothetical protein [Neospora caninum Liverpool]CBZ51083.1 conserved hypothetical protein [Neospora caninum Liverpool]|eukprot:XP_003881116.1 conserved hypothetical protein [Neospora caninum Liverpool]
MGIRRKSRKKSAKTRSSSSSSSPSPTEHPAGEQNQSGPEANGDAPEHPPEPQEAPALRLPLSSPLDQTAEFQSRLLQQLFLQQNMLHQQILTQQEEMKRQWEHQREWEREQEERLAGVCTAQASRGRSMASEGGDGASEECRKEQRQVEKDARQREKEETNNAREEDARTKAEGSTDDGRGEDERVRQEARSDREETLVAKIKMLEAQLEAMQAKHEKERRDEERKQEERENQEDEKQEHEREEQILSRLEFSVAYCSSFEPPYTPEMLTPDGSRAGGKGWRSAPHCSYPQEIGLALASPAQIKFLQLLSHESKIARKIELWVASPTDVPRPSSSPSSPSAPYSPVSSSSLSEAYRRASFTRLGYLRFSANAESRHRARELKSVNLPRFTDCLFIKLLFVGPHCLPEVNSSFQVSLIAVNCLGRPLPGTLASLLDLPHVNPEEAKTIEHDFKAPLGPRRPVSSLSSRDQRREKSPSSLLSCSLSAPPPRASPLGHASRGGRPPSTCVAVCSSRPKQPLSVYLAEKENLLSSAKKKFVEEENFAAAVLVRQALEKLAKAKPHIVELEKTEEDAAAREAFEEARRAKAELLSWQLCVKKTVAAALCCPADPITQAEEREEKTPLKDKHLIEHLAQKLPSSSSSQLFRPDSETLSSEASPLCPCDARRLREEEKSYRAVPVKVSSAGVSESEAEREGRTNGFPTLSPDDMPIRPMHADQQRQLLLLESPERDASQTHETPSSVNFVGQIRSEDVDSASLLSPFFPRDVVCALFAADTPTRSAAQEAVARELESHPEMITGELFVALCPILQRAFADKTLKLCGLYATPVPVVDLILLSLQIFLGGAHLLSLFLESPSLASRQLLSPPFRGVRQELLLRVGGVFSERARRLLLLLCKSHPEVAGVLAGEVFERLTAAGRSQAPPKDAPSFAASRSLGGTPTTERKEEDKRRQGESRGRGRGGFRPETNMRSRGDPAAGHAPVPQK